MMDTDDRTNTSVRNRAALRQTLLFVPLPLLIITAAVAVCSARWGVDRVWGVHVSPDARHIVVLGSKGVSLYRTDDGDRLAFFADARHAAFSTDGTRLAVPIVVDDDATHDDVQIYNIAPATTELQLPAAAERHVRLRFSNDDQHLAVLSRRSGTLRMFNLADGSEQWNIQAHDRADFALSFSPNDEHVITGGSALNTPGHQIRLWNTHDGTLISSHNAKRRAYVDEAAFINDNDTVAITLSDERPNRFMRISDDMQLVEDETHPLSGLNTRVITQTSTSRCIGVGPPTDTWAGKVGVWVATSGENLFTTPALPGLDGGAALVEGGRHLVTASSGGHVQRWEIDTGSLIETLPGFTQTRWSRPLKWIGRAAAIWFVLWLGQQAVSARRAASAGKREGVLIAAIAFFAAAVLFAIAWIETSVGPSSVRSIALFPLIGTLALFGCAVLATLAFTQRSWQAITAALCAATAVPIATVVLWMEAVASV